MHKCVLAVSGGVDSAYLISHVLKHLNTWGLVENDLVGVYVNHNTEQSPIFEQTAKNLCLRFNIDFITKKIPSDDSYIQGVKDYGQEGYWRKERYRLLQEETSQLLMTGHHARDNTETMLYNLIKGTGVSGLSGIKKHRQSNNITIVRPLINLDKSFIKASADAMGLIYVEDLSNKDVKYDRNFIRSVLKQIRGRHPSIDSNFSRAADVFLEAELCLKDLVESDFNACTDSKGNLFENIITLKSKEFLCLPWYRQNLLIKHITNQYRLSKGNINAIVSLINKAKTAEVLKFQTAKVKVVANRFIVKVSF